MMRRFYRSRLFWCGVPGLVFLLWVWWDSGGYNSYVVWQRGNEVREVRVERGAAVWGIYKFSEPASSKGPSVRRWALEVEDVTGAWSNRGRQLDFRRPVEKEVKHGEPNLDGISFELVDLSLGLWVMVLGYVAVWLGAVFAWQRRKARVMRDLTEMEMEKEVGR